MEREEVAEGEAARFLKKKRNEANLAPTNRRRANRNNTEAISSGRLLLTIDDGGSPVVN